MSVEATQIFPVERKPGVHRFLVTTEKYDQGFNIAVGMFANGIETRENKAGTWTTLYTVFDEEAEVFIKAAQACGVTVQQRVEAEPYWRLVIKGAVEPWEDGR